MAHNTCVNYLVGEEGDTEDTCCCWFCSSGGKANALCSFLVRFGIVWFTWKIHTNLETRKKSFQNNTGFPVIIAQLAFSCFFLLLPAFNYFYSVFCFTKLIFYSVFCFTKFFTVHLCFTKSFFYCLVAYVCFLLLFLAVKT